MASRVLMPKLTDTMEEGVLLRWYKHEGDGVESGDVIAEIETDKAVMDLEAYASGVLRKILVPEGAHVPAGALIAVIGKEGEEIESLLGPQAPGLPLREAQPAPLAAPQKAAPPEGAPAAEAPQPPQPPPSAEGQARPRVKVSPLARRVASELAVDLGSIHGTGPHGRITRADVEKAAGSRAHDVPMPPSGAAAPAGGGGQERPLSSMRRAIARKMVQSKAPVPHFYVSADLEMDRALDLKAQLKEAWGAQAPSLTAFILRASAISLQKVPEVNASFMEDRILLHRDIHIGIAVGLEEGLIVPVLRNCGGLGLRQIGQRAEQLIAKARTRRLRPEEYAGATFSISNLGMFGVESFIAVITPPEAAALAVGRVREQPLVRDGHVVAGRVMRITLSCDHRAIDGVVAARFVQEMKQALEQPFRLLSGADTS